MEGQAPTGTSEPAEASPEGQPAAPIAEGQPETGTQQVALTPEEVEKQWQHRVSQKDKAHAAAEQALRDERDALKRQLDSLSAPRPQSNGQSATGQQSDPEVELLRSQLADQRKATEAAEQARLLETRRSKYPALSRSVGEAGIDVFKTADEATLARLNAQLDDGLSGSGTFASPTPRRPAATPVKKLTEMSKQELEAEMARAIEGGAVQRQGR